MEIPDFTRRRDEIGHLSGTLRDMTNALYSRIEAIESFAADVAHELKNPLTSLRSAVETLPLAKTDESRRRLLAVIQHDVKRLDRLITDISDASRLEAEMQRQEANPVDLIKLLTAVTSVANEVPREDGVKVTLNFEGGNAQAFIVPGHNSRLVQVVNNLVDNARSFSPPDGTVRLICRRLKSEIEIVVDDDGPGIAPDVLEKIFDRFYTDRPHRFGQNSGLGLSISKQIVEAHAGRIWAENRMSVSTPDGERLPCLARASSCACRRSEEAATPTVHASAVLIGSRAMLIRGPAGSGKSRLALALIGRRRRAHPSFARLVADDRVELTAAHGRLLAASWPARGTDRSARRRRPTDAT